MVIDDVHSNGTRPEVAEGLPRAAERHVRSFVVACIISAVVTLVFLLWVVLGFGGARVTDAVDVLGELVAALVGGLACMVAARHVATRKSRWVLLGASCLAWAAGEAAWSYYDLVRGESVPFPSLADVGFLLAIPLAVAGLLRFPSSPRRAADRVQGILDGCIIAGSMLFASWATILGPLNRNYHGGVFKQTLALSYPASDVIMVSLVIILISRASPTGRSSLFLVMAGVVAFAMADSAFSYFTEVNNYITGNFLDTGWVAGYLLIALGALRATYVTSAEGEGARETTLSLVAPYVPVLAVLVVTSVELLLGHRVDTVGWIMAVLLSLLVLGRQGLRIWDRARLWPQPDDVTPPGEMSEDHEWLSTSAGPER